MEEQLIRLPWIVTDTEKEGKLLLVSTPDSNILEFPISEEVAGKLPDLFNSADLWQTVFSSLVQSLESA